MPKRRTIAVLVILVIAGLGILAGLACAPLRVATGLTSHLLCSGTFVSGLPPEAVYAAAVRPMVKPVSWGMSYEIDRDKKEVRANFLGGAPSRAVYRPGLGCLVVRGEGPIDDSLPSPTTAAPALPAIAGDAVVEPTSEALRRALDHAFAETDPRPRRTQAVVVVYRGRIVAERYAPGYGIDTPLLGWSLSKSITSALVGILVQKGKLALDAPAPVRAWADPRNPRHAITVDELVRQTTGLRLTESGGASDENSRILLLVRDAAAEAERAPLDTPPGAVWRYASGNAIILSHIIRELAGGRNADYLKLARDELFGPLGMHSVTIEIDATGTAYGGSFMLATPRDWARFGMLYLHDGVVGGRRILPEGWVRYSSTRTLGGVYGAGFWLARPDWRARWRVPADFFLGTGIRGQRLVIIPSEELVLVRLGAAEGPDDIALAGLGQLVSEVREALGEGGGSGPGSGSR
jgi:CubicO group peptidase (beta-lactamase class C family)